MRQLFICMLFLCPVIGYTQQKTSILDRKVDVSFTNEKVAVVLNRIGQQAGFSFSYNSTIISDDQVVTVSLKDKTVQEVLNEVFKGSMTYKEKGNHLILSRVEVKQSRGPSVTSMIISGYIENVDTMEKIVDASVYEKETISSVLSDEFGFFRIKLDKKEEEALTITISKKDFRDTTLVIDGTGNQYFHISLKSVVKPPDPATEVDTTAVPVIVPIDTTSNVIIEAPIIESQVDEPAEDEPMEELVLPYESSPNVQNITEPLHREIQLSLLPFIGTNGGMSGNIVNTYSFNILGGYSAGTEQIEMAGWFNIDRGDVGFLQIAGFGNMVGGNVNGFQAAGLFNIAGGVTTGVQVAGLTNVNVDVVDGVQVAGLANINLSASNGVQVAGIYNQSSGNSGGVRVAGIGNVHVEGFDGPQIAGIFNVNRGLIRGSQIAGIYNYGHKVYGTQIGFINTADSLTGVPIGFLSFVKKGYHKVELSADEVFYTNLSFRTGVRKFYNIIFAGIRPEFPLAPDGMWTFGYGFGTAPRLARWLFLNIDITSQQVNNGEWAQSLSMLNRLQLGFDFQIAPRFSIYAGATLNGYLTEVDQFPILFPGGTLFPPLGTVGQFAVYKPPVFYDEDLGNEVNMKMWIGWKVALRFF